MPDADNAANAAADNADRLQSGFQDHVAEPARRATEAMRHTGQKAAENGSTLGLKVIDQAETNAHEAFAAMRRAAAASDLSEVMRVQGDYLREQGARSMAQAREIGDLIMQFGRDAVSPFSTRS